MIKSNSDLYKSVGYIVLALVITTILYYVNGLSLQDNFAFTTYLLLGLFCLWGSFKLCKSKKFIVQSLQPMSSSSPIGTVVNFKSVRSETLIPGAQPTEVIFTGRIIENNPPRLVGRSSTLKLKIDTMKVGNITYHTVAYISRMGKKMVMTGVLTGNPIYMENLADTANRGTITIDKVYKDPCKFYCESIKSPIRPLYYLGGAVLQVADLLLSPVICVFKRGGEIEIPQYTSFEIKLEDSVSLLKL